MRIVRQYMPMLPTQWDFLQATEQQVLMSGSAGSGKSLSLCAKAIQQAQIPGNTFLLLRKWLVNLKSSTLRTLLDGEGKRPPMLPPGTYRHNRSEKLIHLYGGGDIVYAGEGDDITRIRSPTAPVNWDSAFWAWAGKWILSLESPKITQESGWRSGEMKRRYRKWAVSAGLHTPYI